MTNRAVTVALWGLTCLALAAPAATAAPAPPERERTVEVTVPADGGEPVVVGDTSLLPGHRPSVASTEEVRVDAGCTNVFVYTTTPHRSVTATGPSGTHEATMTVMLGVSTFEATGLDPDADYKVEATAIDGSTQTLPASTSSGCPTGGTLTARALDEPTDAGDNVELTITPPAGATGWQVESTGTDTYPTIPIMLSMRFSTDEVDGRTETTQVRTEHATHRLQVRFANEHGYGLPVTTTVDVDDLQLPWEFDGTRQVTRLAGAGRYETAVELAGHGFGVSGDGRILVASGENFPDALASANLGGSLLLVGRDVLPGTVRETLQSLPADSDGDVTLVGGPAAISETVAQAITAAVAHTNMTVARAAGVDRYDTVSALLDETWRMDVGGRPATVLLASGTAFPDALAAGPFVSGDVQLLLTDPHTLPAPTRQDLADLAEQDDEGARVLLLGGTAAVSNQVAGQVAEISGVVDVDRVAGADRVATARALIDELQVGPADAYTIARGDSFADALAAGQLGHPIVLTAAPNLAGEPLDGLVDTAGCFTAELLVAGGPAALDDRLLDGLDGCDAERGRQVILEELGGAVALNYMFFADAYAGVEDEDAPLSVDALFGWDAPTSGKVTAADVKHESLTSVLPLGWWVSSYDEASGRVTVAADLDGDGTCERTIVLDDIRAVAAQQGNSLFGGGVEVTGVSVTDC